MSIDHIYIECFVETEFAATVPKRHRYLTASYSIFVLLIRIIFYRYAHECTNLDGRNLEKYPKPVLKIPDEYRQIMLKSKEKRS